MKNYQLLKTKYVEEVNSKVSLYRHVKSGARVVTFENEDDNKVFGIGFRTPPTDSTGVPHILEHSTLCGSKKFPVKDPFVELLKSSLNTFLNAMTFPDKTVYPVASRNDKDFANLMEVYLDAVFYPNVYIHPEIFKQEGWHYELNDPSEEITLNGVVYNEMKGAFSSAEQVVARQSRHALFPDTTYGVESGGDPEFIPELTYEAFKGFHSKFYHPSNSYIILYGNCNMEERMAWMDKEYLSSFDVIDPNSLIAFQKPFDKPNVEKIFYPVGKEESLENKTYYSFNVCVGTFADHTLSTAFSIIRYALLEAPGAPLKQALLDAGLGSDVLSEFDSGLLQPVFNITVKDAPSGKLEEFKKVIHDTLATLVTNGINKRAFLSAINLSEFRSREADFGGAPKGLVYGLSSFDTWLYDETDPFTGLEFNETFKLLKENLDNHYFEDCIEKYLLTNTHLAYIVCEPSNTLSEEREKALKEKLASYKATLSNEQIKDLISDTKALKEYQASPSKEEDMAKMPKLSRNDISRTAPSILNNEVKIAEVLCLEHPIFTSGISYIKFSFDAAKLPNELLPYAGLLSKVLGYVDTANYTYQDLDTEISIHTGGIEAEVSSVSALDGKAIFRFDFNARVLTQELPFVFNILSEIITSSSFASEKRLFEIITQAKSEVQMMIMGSGHAMSMRRASAYIQENAYINDQLSGIGFYKFLEELCVNFNTCFKDIVRCLEDAAKIIFRKENLIISYTDTSHAYRDYVEAFAKNLYTLDLRTSPYTFTKDLKNEGFKTPSLVQYVARVGNYNNVGSYTGAFLPFKVALSFDYLWNQVRVLGGAYGCMCAFRRSGDISFVSYRDPKLDETMKVYENVPTFIDNFNPTDEELTKYVISAFGDLDAPHTPRTEGDIYFNYYLTGITNEFLQKERDEAIDVSLKDIKALKPLVEEALKCNAMCVIGNEGKVDASTLFKVKENLFK